MFTRLNPPPMLSASPAFQSPPSNTLNSPDQRFSLAHLKSIYQKLFDNKVVDASNEDLIVEILYNLAEMVVYGDNKSELLFDFFCEKNMLSLFLELMWTQKSSTDKTKVAPCPNKVHIQILQTLSILINSVRNDTSLYYLLSNNYINEIIVFPHIFDHDESLRDQFVSFIKSLSLRLNGQTVQFFFVEETGAFPLLSRAIDVLRFRDPMVRIACQTVILNILQVSDPRSRQYALQDDLLYKFLDEVIMILEKYYHDLVKDSLEYQDILQSARFGTSVGDKALERLENSINDNAASFEDWIYFIQDVMGLHILKLRKAVVSHILSQFIYSSLLSSFTMIAKKKNIDYEMFSIKKYTSSELTSSEASPLPPPKKDSLFEGEYVTPAITDDNKEGEDYAQHGADDMNGEIQAHYLLDRYSVKEMNGIVRNQGVGSSKSPRSTPVRTVSAVDDDNDNVMASISSDEECLIRASVALYFLASVLRIVVDPLMHRAITVAVLHPINMKGRDHILHHHSEPINILSYRNLYRSAFASLLQSGGRLAMMASMFWLTISSSATKLSFYDAAVDNRYEENDDENRQVVVKLPKKTFSHLMLLQSKMLYEWDNESRTSYIQASASSNISTMMPLSKSCSTGSYDSVKQSYGTSSSPQRMMMPPSDHIASKPVEHHNDEDRDEVEAVLNLDIEFAMEPTSAATSHISSLTSELQEYKHDHPHAHANMIADMDSLDADDDMMMARTELSKVDDVVYDDQMTSDGMDTKLLTMRSLVSLDVIATSVKVDIFSISDLLFTMLSTCYTDLPLVTIQMIAYGLYGHALITHDALVKHKASTIQPSSTSSIQPHNSSDSNLPLDDVKYMLSKLYKSMQPLATALAERLRGPMSDLIIDIIVEELRRKKDASWSSYFPKVSQLPTLFLPTTSASLENLGIDYSTPSGQVDTLRREIQTFILLRSLYVQTKRTEVSPDHSFSIDDLGSRVMDDVLWSTFLEKVNVPPEIHIGRPFKMKGKRYLDVSFRTRESSNSNDASANITSPASTTSDTTLLSALTFGYFGSSTRRVSVSSPSPDAGVITSPPSGMTSASNSPMSMIAVTPNGTAITPNIRSPLKSTIGEILFIQDRSYLIIVKPEATSKSPMLSDKKGNVFKVHAVAPLMYTDATVDPYDRTTLRIIVRAWEGDNHPNMEKIGYGDNTVLSSPRYGYGSTIPCLLPRRKNTCLFQINIGFEYQQACALAAEHIEGRKNILREDRLKMLKKGLATWTDSDSTSMKL